MANDVPEPKLPSGLQRSLRTAPSMVELGIAGTRIFGGFISEEQNPALQGLKGLDTFRQMTFDPTVAATLRAIRQPIQAAKWFVEPASDDPNDIYLADFIHHIIWQFGSMSFDEVVRLGIGGPLESGFQPLEIVYDRVMSGEFAGLVGWNKLAWRAPRSRLKWNVEEIDTPGGARIRELISMTQQAAPSYQTVDIPRDKLLLFTNERLGENFDGISLCRYMYQPWFYKQQLLTIQSIGLERAYMGIIDLELPEDYTKEEFEVGSQIVSNLRTGENSGAVHTAAMKLQVHGNKLEGSAMQAAIDFHDTQITQTVLAQFLKLGQNKGGAYNLSEDQSDLFLVVLNSYANQFSQVLNLWPGVEQLIDINFANVDPAQMPKLAHGSIGQRDLDRLGRVFSALGQWGFLTPDNATEDKLREQLELPERDNTITPEALEALTQQLSPRDVYPGEKYPPQIEPWTGTGYPLRDTVDTSKAGPNSVGGVNQAKMKAQQARKDANSKKAATAKTFSEMVARQPWRRGNMREPLDRMRMEATEQLVDYFESSKPSGAPERPSISMAKKRKPYVIRFAEPKSTGEFAAEQRKRSLGLPRTVVVAAEMAETVAANDGPSARGMLARKHEHKIRNVLRTRRAA